MEDGSRRAKSLGCDAGRRRGEELVHVRAPSRGDVWRANLSPTTGHETREARPCLIVSVDLFNHSPAELVVVLPITTREKGIPLHVEVSPLGDGVTKRSFITCEELRTVSRDRLTSQLGKVSEQPMAEVSDRDRILLGL